tara:strand:+ start:62 stop:844 length:783 start_codon:yes stop_codon:yes gene_type:complete
MKITYLIPLLFVTLISCGLATDKNKETMTEKVKVFVSWPGAEARPHYYWDNNKNEPEGIEPQLIRRILELANLDYEFIKDFKFSGKGDPRIEAIVSGSADISIRGISINESRKTIVDFSTPYYIDGLGMLVSKNSGISNIDNLKDKKVYAHEFTTAYNWVQENISECKLVTDPQGQGDYIEPEQLLTEGKIDAYFLDYSFLKNIERNNPKLLTLESKYTREPLGIAVNKDRKDLLKAINKALRTLEKTGELDKLISGFNK